ncbi:MAG: hypothetical protein K0R09_2703 [Clostridiales bacterium]|jgi:hypothetical protein|nr:hypothetical protein [Clostridiales bacterium]
MMRNIGRTMFAPTIEVGKVFLEISYKKPWKGLKLLALTF